MKRKLYRDEQWLREQYWERGLSLSQIGSLCGVCAVTICNWMIKLNVSRRTKSENGLIINLGGPYRNEEWLCQKYLDEGLSPCTIAGICGVGKTTINDWLERFGIQKRGLSEAIKLALPKSMARKKMYNEDWRCKNAEATKAAWERGVYNDIVDKWSAIRKKAWQDGAYDGVFQSPTSIEIEISQALDIVGMSHKSQYHPAECSFIFDEFIPPNALIEIQGDYWHGNPAVYSQQSLDEIQRENIRRDAEKAEWAKENNFDLIYLWENDIKEFGAWPLLRNRLPELFVCEWQ